MGGDCQETGEENLRGDGESETGRLAVLGKGKPKGGTDSRGGNRKLRWEKKNKEKRQAKKKRGENQKSELGPTSHRVGGKKTRGGPTLGGVRITDKQPTKVMGEIASKQKKKSKKESAQRQGGGTVRGPINGGETDCSSLVDQNLESRGFGGRTSLLT